MLCRRVCECGASVVLTRPLCEPVLRARVPAVVRAPLPRTLSGRDRLPAPLQPLWLCGRAAARGCRPRAAWSPLLRGACWRILSVFSCWVLCVFLLICRELKYLLGTAAFLDTVIANSVFSHPVAWIFTPPVVTFEEQKLFIVTYSGGPQLFTFSFLHSSFCQCVSLI